MSDVGLIRAILIAVPDAIQESLVALLGTIPSVEVVATAGGGLSAVAQISEKLPNLAIIDGNLSEDEMMITLKDLKRSSPRIRTLVLTYTTRQQQRSLALGADGILPRWSPTRQLTAIVTGKE